MSINELFANNSTTTATNGGTLPGTIQLTDIASSLASNAMKLVNEDMEQYGQLVVLSQKDPASLDKIVGLVDIDKQSPGLDFLRNIDDATIISMLKSQQSKRSRCKSKEMTKDNYMSMLTAAFAETLIRLVTGKEKGNYGGRMAGTVSYSDERLAQLANDQEALRKEIRNIQSKKSIMKSKAGFTEENNERWDALLAAQDQLISMRISNGGTTRVVVDETRNSLKEMLAEVEPNKLKAADLKQLLESIKDLAFDDVTADDAYTTAEADTSEDAQQ